MGATNLQDQANSGALEKPPLQSGQVEGKEVSLPQGSDLEQGVSGLKPQPLTSVDISDSEVTPKLRSELSDVRKHILRFKENKDFKEAKKKPRPAVLLASFKSEGGEASFVTLSIGITNIAFQSADKAQVISTFGDSFLVQSFGRYPTSVSLSGVVLSYGTLPEGWNMENWWRGFLSFSSFYEGILYSRKFEQGFVTFAFLHYNNVLYKCLFSQFQRAKSAQAHQIEQIAVSGIVLESRELPYLEVGKSA